MVRLLEPVPWPTSEIDEPIARRQSLTFSYPCFSLVPRTFWPAKLFHGNWAYHGFAMLFCIVSETNFRFSWLLAWEIFSGTVEMYAMAFSMGNDIPSLCTCIAKQNINKWTPMDLPQGAQSIKLACKFEDRRSRNTKCHSDIFLVLVYHLVDL